MLTFTMKLDTRAILTLLVLCSVTVSGNNDVLGEYDEDKEVERSERASGIEGDDAEFWERFLGYYVSC